MSDTVVVGAGIVGLSIAWRVATAGLVVTLVDPAPGSAASSVAAGMLAPVGEAHPGEEPLLALAVASARTWPAFASALEAAAGRSVGLVERGTVLVALDADDRARLDHVRCRIEAMGLAVEVLRSQELRSLEPSLAPGVRRGLLAPDDHAVDPPAALAALEVAAARAGVRTLRDGVARIDHTRGAVTGVTTTAGRWLPAARVVVAAGSWSSTVEGLPEPVAVRPVKGQILELRATPTAPVPVTRVVRGFVRGAAVYLVPRVDGRIVVGATTEERGWDRTTTAGAVHDLLRDALALVPGLDELELVATRCGLRPGTPDNLPLIGPTDVDGLVLATGHHRNGVLLAPITAAAVLALLTDAAGPPEVAPCLPARFAPLREAR